MQCKRVVSHDLFLWCTFNELCTHGDSKHHISCDKVIMVSCHGTITELVGISEDCEAYVEQLESYFVANGITTAVKKRTVLLDSCGTSTYKTIHIMDSVMAPDKLTEVSYANLTKKL